MKRTLAIVLASVLMLVSAAGCSNGSNSSASPSAGEQSSAAASASGEKDNYKVSVIVMNTQSAYWQYAIIGANNAAKENPKITLTTSGPPTSKDVDKQIAIMEDTINRKPDAIVLAACNADSLVPSVQSAVSKGIKVICIDHAVNTDVYSTVLKTDNVKAGENAAEALIDQLTKKGVPLKGKVGLISPYSGVQVMTDRETGFREKLKEIAPDIAIVGPKYIDNDPIKGVGAVEDVLTANDDIVGFYGINDMCATSISRVITEKKLNDSTVCIGFDSDPEEINGLKNGALDALIVQDPYTMGYQGVKDAIEAVNGKTLEKMIDTGANVVTKDNMDTQQIKELLDPTLKKK